MLYQLGALEAFLRPYGQRLHHVTPHGSLGNMTAVREDYARAVARAVRTFDPNLTVAFQESWMTRAAEDEGLRSLGSVSRIVVTTTTAHSSQDFASIRDGRRGGRDVLCAWRSGVVTSVSATLPLPCDSILVHGDSPAAVAMAATVRRRLEAAGVTVAAWPGR